ncbi:MAG: hypothetical protein HY744_14540 [Deltaproteobacteria bacterium]|nr:hypothetical protein [Deltaproteobacteria bacterium]
MSAATIVFFDLVGFSKRPTAEQRELIDGFNAELARLLRPHLCPPDGPPEAIALPTGDGIAVALLHRDRRAWSFDTVTKLLLAIDGWAGADGGRTSVRVGIHNGVVELVTDINGRTNICGATINRAQRVMDAADPDQVLLSEEALAEHIGTSKQGRCEGPFDVLAKHDLHLSVYALKVPGRWRTSAPAASRRMVVKLTDLPKRVEGTFAERLRAARKVALVQLTGKHALPRLQEDPCALSPDLHTLRVFMPHPAALAAWGTPMPARADHEKYLDAWRELLGKLRRDRPSIDIRLGLFSEPPYFGGSFLDWDLPNGHIHVSPYLCACGACQPRTVRASTSSGWVAVPRPSTRPISAPSTT